MLRFRRCFLPASKMRWMFSECLAWASCLFANDSDSARKIGDVDLLHVLLLQISQVPASCDLVSGAQLQLTRLLVTVCSQQGESTCKDRVTLLSWCSTHLWVTAWHAFESCVDNRQVLLPLMCGIHQHVLSV